MDKRQVGDDGREATTYHKARHQDNDDVAELRAQLLRAQARIAELEARQGTDAHHPTPETASSVGAAPETTLRLLWQAVNQSPASVMITDSAGDIVFVNPYFTQVTGYTSDEVTGHNPRILQSGLTPPEQYPVLWETITTGREWRGEFCNRRKDGTLFWEQARIAPVLDENGCITHFIGIKEDITERKQAEIALRESERRFRTLVNSMDDIVFTLDHEGRHTGVYGRWLVRHQLTPELFIGRSSREILGDEAASVHETARAQALAGETVVYEWTSRGFTTQTSLSPIEDDAGHITGVVGIGRDITELTSLQHRLAAHSDHLEALVEERTEQLRRLNERLNTVLNNVSNPVLLISADGRIDITNSACDRVLGQSPGALSGVHLSAIFPADQRSTVLHLLAEAPGQSSTGPLQAQVVRRDGRLFDAEISLSAVPNSDGQLVCTLYDISHLKQMERVKDEFISMVNHELRTPITSIMLTATTLQQYFERLADDRKLEKVAQIVQQSQTLAELVTSILDISRLDARQDQRGDYSVDVRQAMYDAIEDLGIQAEAKGQTISARAYNSVLTVRGEHFDLVRIWRNLLSNAIKYTQDGGHIVLSLYGAAGGPYHPLLDTAGYWPQPPPDLDSGAYIVGVIEDNGHGITPQDIPQLFTRFFRGWAASTSITGTGLGLALVHDLLTLYNGGIAVRSTLDAGTTFCFWLPIAEDPATGPADDSTGGHDA